MKLNSKKLLAGLAVGLLSMPQAAIAQSAPITIKGMVNNWYYYGKAKTENTVGWQQNIGADMLSGGGWLHNIGLMSHDLTPGATSTRPLSKPFFNIRNNLFYGKAGVYTGDAYYTFHESETGWEDNMDGEYGSESYEVVVRKWTWDGVSETAIANDLDVFEGVAYLKGDYPYTNLKVQQVGKMYNTPTDLTYDPLNDVVYGCFNIGDGYKIGTIDMETLKITYISKESISVAAEIRALAINSKGELYGIDASGNVYNIDKTDGTLKTIGNVGFKSQRLPMSATFDLRTDKLYWLGYMNNGKISAATDGTNNTLSVADGGRNTAFYEVDTKTGLATLIDTTGYKKVDITYDEYGEITGAQTKVYGKIALCGIYVEGSFQKHDIDLRAMLKKVPAQLRCNEASSITVNVKNIGLTNVKGRNYQVELYADNKLLGIIDYDSDDDIYTENLNKGVSHDYTFSYSAPAKAGKVTIYAKVVCTGDEELRNNTTELATIIVVPVKILPTVQLGGTKSAMSLKLTWGEPDGLVTDGAEKYAPFTYDGLSDWTMVDLDGGYTQSPGSWNSAVSYANSSTPKAYIVFNPELAGINLTGSVAQFAPHTGNQYFAAFYTAVPGGENGGTYVANDDYMVSPTLNGKAQTLSFWAKGYKGMEAEGYATMADYKELMRILYTTDENNLDPTTYTVLKDTLVVDNTAWTRYTADLPAGAKHFALHCCSKPSILGEDYGDYGNFVLMIDDITFNVNQPEVLGFKVYKNGNIESVLTADKRSYEDFMATAKDVYTVSVIYEDGESDMSNEFGLGMATGIEKAVTDVHQATTSLYDLNGRSLGSNLRPGLYIMQRDGKARKVIVK